jgi:hypothetical protein
MMEHSLALRFTYSCYYVYRGECACAISLWDVVRVGFFLCQLGGTAIGLPGSYRSFSRQQSCRNVGS